MTKSSSGKKSSLMLMAITPTLDLMKIASPWKRDTFRLTGAKYSTPKNLIMLLVMTILGLAFTGTVEGSFKSSRLKIYTLF